MKSQTTKFWHRIATIVGITFGLIVLAAPAEADSFRVKGKEANAFFFSTDPSECIFTEVFVFTGEDAEVSNDPPGPPNSSSLSLASIFLSQFDSCNGIQLVFADCLRDALPDSDFHIGKKLDLATLNTTLDCSDLLGGPSFDVSVALTWTAVGDLVRERNSVHLRTPGFIVNERFRGTFRSAEASGSVSDATTNFTPNPSEAATIGNVTIGNVTIDKR
jgi:hypothetical protein